MMAYEMNNIYELIAGVCGILALLCQMLFIFGLVRNMIIKKTLIGWVFPDGTTKKEKMYLAVTLALMFLFAIVGAFLPRK